MKYSIVDERGRIIAKISSEYYVNELYRSKKGFFRDSEWKGKKGPAYEITEGFTFGDSLMTLNLFAGYTIEQE